MVRFFDNLVRKGVDWLYEHTLGITSPSEAAKLSPEQRREMQKVLTQGYAGRPVRFVDPPRDTDKDSGRGDAETGRQDHSVNGHHPSDGGELADKD